MKLIEVEPICESYVEILNRDDLTKIVESPLLEACQYLYDKHIRTLMTSANRFNVVGLNKLSQNVEKFYSYGEHFAWLWIDYGSLSPENKKLVQSWYAQDKEKDSSKRLFLCTISNHPESWDFDAFIIQNQVQLNTPCYSDSAFIMRYPVNEETTVEEVRNYFLQLANSFFSQSEKLQEGPREALKELCEHFQPYLNLLNLTFQEIPLDPCFHSYNILIDDEGKYRTSHNAGLERTILLLSALESNHLLRLNHLPQDICFVEDPTNQIRELKRITCIVDGKSYQVVLSEKDPKMMNLEFGSSDNLEDLKKDRYLLSRLSHFDWNQDLQPTRHQIQYKIYTKEKS